MPDRRKIWKVSNDGPFIEVGEGHVKIGYSTENFIVINSGGITQQGKLNIQGSPTDTNYYGLFSPQNEWVGSFTMGMFSAPQYVPNPAIFNIIPGIISLVNTMIQVNKL